MPICVSAQRRLLFFSIWIDGERFGSLFCDAHGEALQEWFICLGVYEDMRASIASLVGFLNLDCAQEHDVTSPITVLKLVCAYAIELRAV